MSHRQAARYNADMYSLLDSHLRPVHLLLLACSLALAASTQSTVRGQADDSTAADFLAPVAVRYAPHSEQLVVLGSNGERLVLLDARTGGMRRIIKLPGPGSDLLVRGHVAYVSICLPAGQVCLIDLHTATITRRLSVGHSPSALALSSDGGTLCVANRFDHTVDLIQPRSEPRRTIRVLREPVALALTADDSRLFVANQLPVVRPFLDDENPHIAAEISMLDVAAGEVAQQISLPNGSQGLRLLALSPDNQYLVATHILSNYTVPTMELEQGAMNRNVLSILRTDSPAWLATVPLDDPAHGAASPWAIAFRQAAHTQLLITHAGTQELSLVDFDALLARLDRQRPAERLFDPDTLTTMSGIRQRTRCGVRGPRALAVHGDSAFVAGFFSDDVAVLDLTDPAQTARVIWRDPEHAMPQWRQGEQLFHDASLCHQQWQSCASCHPDGRSDVLYWDLLNDGIGNTKNTKSLLMSALTPPVMWRGVRADARAAIRAGVHHIQFGTARNDQAAAIEAFLKHLPVVPSPHLNAAELETPKTEDASCAKCHSPGIPRGTLTESARRGKTLFEGKAGCVACHPHPLFTIQRSVDPGLGSGIAYDVPSLVEVWRTAPYLHSGDALNLHEAIVDFNYSNRRGDTKALTEKELNDLIEYVKSL